MYFVSVIRTYLQNTYKVCIHTRPHAHIHLCIQHVQNQKRVYACVFMYVLCIAYVFVKYIYTYIYIYIYNSIFCYSLLWKINRCLVLETQNSDKYVNTNLNTYTACITTHTYRHNTLICIHRYTHTYIYIFKWYKVLFCMDKYRSKCNSLIVNWDIGLCNSFNLISSRYRCLFICFFLFFLFIVVVYVNKNCLRLEILYNICLSLIHI